MFRMDRGAVGPIVGACIGFLAAFAPAFGQSSVSACRSDDDCKAPRQCDEGRCKDPAPRSRPVAPAAPAAGAMPLCHDDRECRGARVCDQGLCIDPLNPNAPPMAPIVSAPPPGAPPVSAPPASPSVPAPPRAAPVASTPPSFSPLVSAPLVPASPARTEPARTEPDRSAAGATTSVPLGRGTPANSTPAPAPASASSASTRGQPPAPRPLIQDAGSTERGAVLAPAAPVKSGQRFVPPSVVSVRRLSRPGGAP